MREIPVTDIGVIRIGQTENAPAGTGLTVFIAENGMRAGLDVRGGGPASRESQLLNPLMAAQVIHAIVLSGGSAFGLGAANGVMEYLEERGYGYDVGVTKVPLVAQSDIFDLTVGDPFVRPDRDMGYEAARIAFEAPNYKDGNYGAGCGATVGKLLNMDYCMKSGIGSYALQTGDLKIGAVVVVNALGDVYDWKTGRQIAGLLTADRLGLRSTAEQVYGQHHPGRGDNQRRLRQGAAKQDRGHGPRRLRPEHKPRAHLRGRGQHLRRVRGGRHRGPGPDRHPGRRSDKRGHHPGDNKLRQRLRLSLRPGTGVRGLNRSHHCAISRPT